jgi:NAD(P)-dependent dehydrogenase (short-subunit alcohol dehydrogenase family)
MANILITGANKGIGLELVTQYASRGDTVYAACRNPGQAAELSSLENVTAIEVQVGDDQSVTDMASNLNGVAIDVLINNAGTSGPKPQDQSVFNMDFAGWSEAHNINAMAPARVLQALLPNLRAAGIAKVVNITSQLGALEMDMPMMGLAYGATKAALNKFMRLAALDLIKENIYISIIHPGWVRTDMGGSSADISTEESAKGIIQCTDELGPATNGLFLKWNGEPHPW